MSFLTFKFKKLHQSCNNHKMALFVWIVSILVFVSIVSLSAFLSWHLLNELNNIISFDITSHNSDKADNKKLQKIHTVIEKINSSADFNLRSDSGIVQDTSESVKNNTNEEKLLTNQ